MHLADKEVAMELRRNDLVLIKRGPAIYTCVILCIHGNMITVAHLTPIRSSSPIISRSNFILWSKGYVSTTLYLQSVTSYSKQRVIEVIGRTKKECIPNIWAALAQKLSVGESKSNWIRTMSSLRGKYKGNVVYPVSTQNSQSVNSLKGAVCWYDFNYGSMGDEEQKIRPAIVIQDDGKYCLIIPVSSKEKEKEIPFHIPITPEQSVSIDEDKPSPNGFVLLEQVRYVKKANILLCVGLLKGEFLETICRRLYVSIICTNHFISEDAFRVLKKF